MKTGSLSRIRRICLPVMTALLLCLATTGCTPLLNSLFDNALPPMEGVQTVPGLTENVTVRRDSMGIPMIEAASLEDLVFAWAMSAPTTGSPRWRASGWWVRAGSPS